MSGWVIEEGPPKPDWLNFKVTFVPSTPDEVLRDIQRELAWCLEYYIGWDGLECSRSSAKL